MSRTAFILPVIIVAGTLLRLYGIGRDSLWFDELQTIWASRLQWEHFATGLAAWGDAPLYYLFGRVWFGVLNEEYWSRLPSCVAGVGIILLVYLLGRELFNRKAALWASALTAASPFLVWYSRDATLYSTLAAMSLLSIYMLTRAARLGGWQRWTAYCAVTVAVVMTHLFSIALLAAEAVYYLLIRDRGASLRSWLICQAVLVYPVAFTWMLSRSASRMISVEGSVGEYTAWIAEAPTYIFTGALAYRLINDDSWRWLLYGAGTMAIVGAIFFAGWLLDARSDGPDVRQRRVAALIICAAIMLIMVVVIYSTAGGDAEWPYRFYLWMAPLVLLLVAVAVTSVPGRLSTAIGVTLVVGMAGASLLGPSPPTNIDYRESALAISEGYEPGDYLLCFPYPNCVVTSGYYMPEELQFGGGYISREWPRGTLVALYPGKDQWFDYFLHQMTSQYRNNLVRIDLVGGMADEALAGHDRVWVKCSYQSRDSCEELGNYLLPGWDLVNRQGFSSDDLYLYTRA